MEKTHISYQLPTPEEQEREWDIYYLKEILNIISDPKCKKQVQIISGEFLCRYFNNLCKKGEIFPWFMYYANGYGVFQFNGERAPFVPKDFRDLLKELQGENKK